MNLLLRCTNILSTLTLSTLRSKRAITASGPIGTTTGTTTTCPSDHLDNGGYCIQCPAGTLFIHHFHITFTSLSHHFHITFTSLSHHFHITFTSLSHHFHITFTSLSHHFHITFTSLSHHFHITFTSLSHHFHITFTYLGLNCLIYELNLTNPLLQVTVRAVLVLCVRSVV